MGAAMTAAALTWGRGAGLVAPRCRPRGAPPVEHGFAGERVCWTCLGAPWPSLCDRCGGVALSPPSARVEAAGWSLRHEAVADALRFAECAAAERSTLLRRVVWSFAGRGRHGAAVAPAASRPARIARRRGPLRADVRRPRRRRGGARRAADASGLVCAVQIRVFGKVQLSP